MRKMSFDEKYSEIKRDSLYNGIFVTAVVTTGIFCKPSCRARKPLAKNIIFYDTPTQAIKSGFRPCKVCKPMQLEEETPDYITSVIQDLQKKPYFKIKDSHLKERGIEPNKIRRWFNKNHSMTFQAYQRMLRINYAYNQIRGGNSITKTAFGVGYNSLGGFNESWKNIFGNAPKGTKIHVINIHRFATKLGPVFACATKEGVCLIELTNEKSLEIKFKNLCKRLGAVILPGKNKYLDIVELQISNYLDDNLKTIDFNIDSSLQNQDFQEFIQKLIAYKNNYNLGKK